jgi:hypothetical protein
VNAPIHNQYLHGIALLHAARLGGAPLFLSCVMMSVVMTVIQAVNPHRGSRVVYFSPDDKMASRLLKKNQRRGALCNRASRL